MDNPFEIFNAIRRAYLRYLDSPFRLRYEVLLRERRELLDRDSQLYREPLFEPIVPYESSGLNIHDACGRLGVPVEAADFMVRGIFPRNERTGRPRVLYSHQVEAWAASREGKAVVITSGTNSGKTECYLLPIFAYLVEESARGWGALARASSRRFWWRFSRQERISQRANEPQSRPQALRALLLYPLNALIEDQLGRIRRGTDGPEARQWLSDQRAGHHFWFGRYTSMTPVSGPRERSSKQTELRRRLREMDREWDRATRSAVAARNPRILDYFQDPAGAEMWSRWDMQDSPPDILITNYSMLNIMLMRTVEEGIFEKTRQWLAEDRENNVFHLVVDELHSYRGTPGTEVGYLLRAFLHRIGLTSDSPQLRIIATSASIAGDAESLDYLEQFFGRDRSTFRILPGTQQAFSPGTGAIQIPVLTSFAAVLDRSGLGEAAAGFSRDVGCVPTSSQPEQMLAEALDSAGAFESVRMAAGDGPFTLQELSNNLFGGDAGGSQAATQVLLRALILAQNVDREAPLPLRTHYFFRNVGRMWACVNPACSGRGAFAAGETVPPVGRLYYEPRPRCGWCGSRVLELLYCQPCGEVFLGGYKKADLESNNAWYLSPDYPNVEQVPDKSASLERTSGEYMVFWPAGERVPVKSTHAGPRWVWQQDGTRGFQWAPAILHHGMARLSLPPRAQRAPAASTAGYAFLSPDDTVDAFPSKCPHCGKDWARRRIGSPIRDLGSGFQRIVQLLCDALLREIPAGRTRKLVLFSDSRQDAAKLSTGIKLAHYLDTVRQIAYHRLAAEEASAASEYLNALDLHRRASELLELEQRHSNSGLTEPERDRRNALIASMPSEIVGTIAQYAAAGGSQPEVLVLPTAPGALTPVRFNSLLDMVREGLLALGMNPGGTRPSIQKLQWRIRRRIHTRRWSELVDWTASPRSYRAELQPVERQLVGDIEAALRAAVVEDVLFADGSRDFESLGLGFLWVDTRPPSSIAEHAAAATLRILGQGRRWTESENEGQVQPPAYVEAYLEAAASANGLSPGDLISQVSTILVPVLDQWLINPERTVVLAPRQDQEGGVETYDCPRCGRTHLHSAGGVCTSCRMRLPSHSRRRSVRAEAQDYYEYLARTGEPPFRLNSEELTGQTNQADRRSRQRRFQEVFMENEIPDAAGVDLLSVTTTMEAGVDIGLLQAIGLANMPPVRFNYQQRVGRAGRRGAGMSAVLTLCRGRSHDDYYFERPKLMTAEPPPRPYVDVRRSEIAKRVVNKEILRRAFRSIPLQYSGDNVHGEFGTVGEWQTHRPVVEAWINSNEAAVREVCEAVLRRTSMESTVGMASIVDHVRNSLVSSIDEVVQHPQSLPHLALSERMASRGVLPMFGFPTRIRYLFHERPTLGQGGWPPQRGIVDRELDIAISQFAPSAQTVKDDELLTAVGVADFRPSGDQIVASPNPLDSGRMAVGICRRCQGLTESPQGTPVCPYCSAAQGATGYRVAELCEPPGFITWWNIQAEFTGGFEFTPRAMRARIGASPNRPTGLGNFTVDCGQATVIRINDNDGNDFTFRKLDRSEIWVSQQAFDQALRDLPRSQQPTVPPPSFDQTPEVTRALASVSRTDVLVAGLREVPVGLCLNPSVPEARAAWYSFGFLVRRAAAVMLDVAESELDVGLQTVADFSTPFAPPTARIFLSDSLENGAGYSTHIGSPSEFERLLRFVLNPEPPEKSFYAPLVSPFHEAECAGSCHRCLREFGNMAFHPLLDWRLGLDMVRLALDLHAEIDLDYPYWSGLASRIAAPFFEGLGLSPTRIAGLPVGLEPGDGGDALILVHPMWDIGLANLHPRAAQAIAEAEFRGFRPKLHSLFKAVRFPYEFPREDTILQP